MTEAPSSNKTFTGKKGTLLGHKSSLYLPENFTDTDFAFPSFALGVVDSAKMKWNKQLINYNDIAFILPRKGPDYFNFSFFLRTIKDWNSSKLYCESINLGLI